MENLSAAQNYLRKHWMPVPIPKGSKAPKIRNCQRLQLADAELSKHFSRDTNIGLLLGTPSQGLVDVDLDDRAAIETAHAFLPATGRMHGRPSMPSSHWWYLTDPAPSPKKFQDTDGTCLVELRSTGQQTIVPPSTHPSGERLTWVTESEPAGVDGETLHRAVARVASCAILSRHWPKAGTRQDCALALAGALLRAGWSTEETKDFIVEIARVAGDDEKEKRGQAAADTAKRIAADGSVTGLPKLTELFGDQVVSRLSEWLGLKRAEQQQRGEKQASSSPSHGELLAKLTAKIELFHTPEGNAFAGIPSRGHVEIWPIKSKDFEQRFTRYFYQHLNKPLSTQALADMLRFLEARAIFDGPEYPVYLRVAEHEGAIYLDLSNAAWEAVEITPAGWAVIADPPVRFRRTPGMQPLLTPVHGGSVNELQPFVNTKDIESFRLLLAWLVAALRPRGPYPILMLQGEQGSAKSTTARVLRSLVDPSVSPLRSIPRDERDLMISAKTSWIMAFDNLSGLSNWMSDALCRLASGGGYSTRALYTDEEQILFTAQRPIILNGIDDIAARHDLIDRVLAVTLPPISGNKRLDEETFWSQFDASRPRILGALLDAVSEGMGRLQHINLSALPRMADFARWGTATELALGWPLGGFMATYAGNQSEAIEIGLDAYPIAPAIRALLAKQQEWTGTASELLEKLTTLADSGANALRTWPNSSQDLGKQLRRLGTALRTVGIEIQNTREGHDRRRIIVMRKCG